MTKPKPKKSPFVGRVWVGTRFLHIAWRRYNLTVCGISLPDKEEALARGGERFAQGYETCDICLEGANDVDVGRIWQPSKQEKDSIKPDGGPELSSKESNTTSEVSPIKRMQSGLSRPFDQHKSNEKLIRSNGTRVENSNSETGSEGTNT